MPPDFLTGTKRYFTKDGAIVELKELKHGLYHGVILPTKNPVTFDQAGNAVKPDDRNLDLVKGDIPYIRERD